MYDYKRQSDDDVVKFISVLPSVSKDRVGDEST